MGQFPDVKWPAEYIELTRIEDLLHCKICYEYIQISVITPCSHNYCSICIRKFLHYKTQCPICFETIYEKDIHPNRILDEFMESYLSVREKLLSCIKGVEVKEGIKNASDFTPVNNKPVNSPAKTNPESFVETPKRKNSFRDNKTGQSPRNILTPKETPNKNIPGSSTGEKTPKTIDRMFANKNEDRIITTDVNKKRVPCPVCSIEISETNINRHLDDCLKRQRSMSPAKVTKNRLEPMPKYVVNLMKDSELRKLLKQYGLSTSGARKTVEKRLQKFSALYNAERDKPAPKSVEELVKLCEDEETTEKIMLKQNSSDNMLNIDRKTDANVIEKAHKQYLERNKDDYQKLIESINSREKGTRNKSSRSLSGRENRGDSIASTSSAAPATSQSALNQSFGNNETNSSAADTSQYFLQDSDSTNTSYPLQHYSHEDPIRFLALEISSDSLESPIKSETSSTMKKSASIEAKVKSDSPQESRNSWNSNNSPKFTIRCKDFALLGKADEINASNYDMFDASTEDNWSDTGGRESRANKSKKYVMKRAKVKEGENRSTDSDTDVEQSLGHVGRKTAKIKKHRDKKGARVNSPDGNGESRELKSRLEFEGEIDERFGEGSKENSVINRREKTVARRSTRKRNHVSYANARNIRGKKALDEIPTNLVEIKNGEETSRDVREEGKFEGENGDRTANKTLKSLRKRRRL